MSLRNGFRWLDRTTLGEARTKGRTRFVALLVVGLIAAVLAPGQALAGTSIRALRSGSPAARSQGLYERVPAPATAGPSHSLIREQLSVASLDAKVSASQDIVESVDALSAPVVVTNNGVYYWSGGYVHVDGWVENETPTPLNFVQMHVVVTTKGGTLLADETGYVSAHVVAPGEAASFGMSFDLPAYAGSDLDISVDTFGYEEVLPEPVTLNLVSSSLSVQSGLRAYTCVYRNDSAVAVEQPIVGGWELDADDILLDTLFAYSDAQIPPGGSWTATVVGFLPGATPSTAECYCEALPVQPAGTMSVYRFRNLKNGYYLWSADSAETANIIATLAKTWKYEGIAYADNLATNASPLWRFRNLKGGFYLYTADESEKNNILAKLSSQYLLEGAAYNVSTSASGGAQPVWRFRNKKNGTYLYSADPAEKNNIVATLSATWTLEGPAYYLAP